MALSEIKTWLEKLSGFDICRLAKGMSEENRLEAIRLGIKKLSSSHICDLAEGMNEGNIVEVISLSIAEGKDLSEFIKRMGEKTYVKAIKIHLGLEEFEGEYVYDIIRELGKKLGLDILQGGEIEDIFEGMDEENLYKIIKLEFATNRLHQYVLDKVKDISEEKKLELVHYINTSDKYCVWYIIDNIIKHMSKKNKLEVIRLGFFNIGSENILEICESLSDEYILEVIREFKDCCSIEFLGKLLSKISCVSKENEKYFKEFLEKQNFQTDDLSLKILSNFGMKVVTPSNAELVTESAKEIIGEDNIYSLFKYYIFTGSEIKVDKVLENPQLFYQYEEFRKSFKQEKQMTVMNKKDALCEFNNNSDLVKDCLESELTVEETKLLQGVLKDDRVKISSREELSNFSEKRRELVEGIINDSPEEALIYLFTGLITEEYYRKIRQYIRNSELDEIIKEFGEESPELGIIRATNEFIKLIRGMDEEKQKEVLTIYNNDLANEFTEKGSSVANVRKAYEDIEITIRKMYGKELAQSLKKDKIPDVIQDSRTKIELLYSKELSEISEEERENKIKELIEEESKNPTEISQLKGEDFNLLVHGNVNFSINLLVKKFEKREVGKTYICTSLISEKYMGRAGGKVYYGFKNIEDNSLIEEKPQDMYSTSDGRNSLNVTGDPSEFYIADKMIEKSAKHRYNEVVLWRECIGNDGKEKDIAPDYIVCFNEVTKESREEARRLNIPIVLIDEKAYEKNKEENKEKVENEEVKMPEEYEETKVDMMSVLRDASNQCSAHAQQEALQKIIEEMEKQLEANKEMTH